MAIIDSVKLPDNSTYDVVDDTSGYQKETLTTPLTVNGTQETTVEGALEELNDYSDALKTAISHENLLDNPFFTVNQRGQASYSITEYSYTVDRWAAENNGMTVNVSENGISWSRNTSQMSSITQLMEHKLAGKTVTASIKFQNGTIASATGTFPTTGYTDLTLTNEIVCRLGINNNNIHYAMLRNATNNTASLRAVKLELGSVSTLANDVAPDYALELAKCQTSTADPSDTYANQGQLMTSALQSELGAMNFNSYPYYETTKTINGLTFTDIGDGTVTVSGTASAMTEFFIHDAVNTSKNSCVLKNGNYILSGCPNGGSSETYKLGAYYKRKTSGSILSLGNDFGNGASFTVDGGYYSDDDIVLGLEIVIYAGTVISTPITFKPMISDARLNLSYNDHVPFAMTNRELTEKLNGNLDGILSTLTSSNSDITITTYYAFKFGSLLLLNAYINASANIPQDTSILTIGGTTGTRVMHFMGYKLDFSNFGAFYAYGDKIYTEKTLSSGYYVISTVFKINS